METVCILIAKDHLSALSAKALLESNEIICLFPNEYLTGILPQYGVTTGGFKLYINKNDLEDANEVLKDHRGDFEYDKSGSKELHYTKCPKCGSYDLILERSNRPFLALFGALFSIPLSGKKCNVKCNDCGFKWK